MDLVRRCARCRIDYRPEIAVCADCGGELETRYEETDPRFAPPDLPEHSLSVPEPPPGEYRSIYRSTDIALVQPLAEALKGRGIPFRIEVTTLETAAPAPASRYDLCVRDAEREAAREELVRLERDYIAPESFAAIDREFDPEGGYRRCPACSASLSPRAAECPGCGLGLAEAEDPSACSECGQAVGESDRACPCCGAAFDEG